MCVCVCVCRIAPRNSNVGTELLTLAILRGQTKANSISIASENLKYGDVINSIEFANTSAWRHVFGGNADMDAG